MNLALMVRVRRLWLWSHEVPACLSRLVSKWILLQLAFTVEKMQSRPFYVFW